MIRISKRIRWGTRRSENTGENACKILIQKLLSQDKEGVNLCIIPDYERIIFYKGLRVIPHI